MADLTCFSVLAMWTLAESKSCSSTVRIHAPTAIFFAFVTLLSAVSVAATVFVWSSPTEFSQRDCLNLVWSGFSMLIAFVALLVCVELPRFGQEELIRIRVPATLQVGYATHQVTIEEMSTQHVVINNLEAKNIGEAALDFGNLGWMKIDLSTENLSHCFRISPNFEQHNAILRMLFRRSPDNVASTGRLSKSMLTLCRRAFIG